MKSMQFVLTFFRYCGLRSNTLELYHFSCCTLWETVADSRLARIFNIIQNPFEADEKKSAYCVITVYEMTLKLIREFQEHKMN